MLSKLLLMELKSQIREPKIRTRTGLTILAENSGDLNNIVVQNMVIRDVNGSLVKSDGEFCNINQKVWRKN